MSIILMMTLVINIRAAILILLLGQSDNIIQLEDLQNLLRPSELHASRVAGGNCNVEDSCPAVIHVRGSR